MDGLNFVPGCVESNESRDCCVQISFSDLQMVVGRVVSSEDKVSDERSV